MGYQQKSYKKFVATAATATLVASAIVPVASASFSDVAETNEFATYINASVDAGYVKGYADGTFGINDNLKRSQVVIIIGRYLEKLGYTSAETTSPWSDVTSEEVIKYGNIVKDAGVFTGYANGTLNGAGLITRENMAVVLDRLAKTVTGTSLSEVAADIEDVKIADLETAIADYQTSIQALRDLGISTADNFNPKGNVKRGQFAKFIVTAVESINEIAPAVTAEDIAKEIAAVDATLPAVADIKADNAEAAKAAVEAAKTAITAIEAKIAEAKLTTEEVAELEKAIDAVEAKYDAIVEAVEATKQVTIESVKAINSKSLEVTFNTAVEDTTKATIEVLRGTSKQNVTATWAEDKKSVQLAAATNLQAAEYTVNIKGLANETLTGKATVEAQKVASIEILDDIAVVSANADTGVFADNTIATVGYVVKDQYGTDITKSVTTLKSNNEDTITFSKGVITLKESAVEGKKEGDLVPVVLVDTATGTSVTKTVKLSAASTVSTIEVAGIVNAKGEALELTEASKATDAFIVVNLKDQYGKEITEYEKVSGLLITNTNDQNIVIPDEVTEKTIADKEKLVITIDSIKKAGNTDVLLISTTNGATAKFTIKVAETTATDAVAVAQPEIAVKGEKTLIPLTVTDKNGNVITDKDLLSNATKGVKVGNEVVSKSVLEVKDGQVYYAHTFTAAEKTALVFQSSTYKTATITVDVKEEAKPAVITSVKAPIVISTAKKSLELTAKDHFIIEDQYGRVMKDEDAEIVVTKAKENADVVLVDDNVVTANKKGTETLVAKLATELDKTDSSIEVKVQVTDGNEFSAYEVKEIGLVKVSDTAFDLTVNGVLNGGKVALTTDEYTATISGGELDGEVAIENGKITVTAANLNVDEKAETKKLDTEFTVKVTVNATGEVLTHKFTASAKTEETQNFFFTTEASDYKKATAISTATLESGSVATELVSGDPAATVKIATVDQYGTEAVEALVDSTITVVPAKVGEVTISGNGTAKPTISLAEGVEKATVTLKVTVGKATKEITVTVVPAEETEQEVDTP